jgi:hypothetical protein
MEKRKTLLSKRAKTAEVNAGISRSRHKPLSTAVLCLIGLFAFSQSIGSFKGKIIEQFTTLSQGEHPNRPDRICRCQRQHRHLFNTDIPIGTYAVNISSIGYQTKKSVKCPE